MSIRVGKKETGGKSKQQRRRRQRKQPDASPDPAAPIAVEPTPPPPVTQSLLRYESESSDPEIDNKKHSKPRDVTSDVTKSDDIETYVNDEAETQGAEEVNDSDEPDSLLESKVYTIGVDDGAIHQAVMSGSIQGLTIIDPEAGRAGHSRDKLLINGTVYNVSLDLLRVRMSMPVPEAARPSTPEPVAFESGSWNRVYTPWFPDSSWALRSSSIQLGIGGYQPNLSFNVQDNALDLMFGNQYIDPKLVESICSVESRTSAQSAVPRPCFTSGCPGLMERRVENHFSTFCCPVCDSVTGHIPDSVSGSTSMTTMRGYMAAPWLKGFDTYTDRFKEYLVRIDQQFAWWSRGKHFFDPSDLLDECSRMERFTPCLIARQFKRSDIPEINGNRSKIPGADLCNIPASLVSFPSAEGKDFVTVLTNTTTAWANSPQKASHIYNRSGSVVDQSLRTIVYEPSDEFRHNVLTCTAFEFLEELLDRYDMKDISLIDTISAADQALEVSFNERKSSFKLFSRLHKSLERTIPNYAISCGHYIGLSNAYLDLLPALEYPPLGAPYVPAKGFLDPLFGEPVAFEVLSDLRTDAGICIERASFSDDDHLEFLCLALTLTLFDDDVPRLLSDTDSKWYRNRVELFNKRYGDMGVMADHARGGLKGVIESVQTSGWVKWFCAQIKTVPIDRDLGYRPFAEYSLNTLRSIETGINVLTKISKGVRGYTAVESNLVDNYPHRLAFDSMMRFRFSNRRQTPRRLHSVSLIADTASRYLKRNEYSILHLGRGSCRGVLSPLLCEFFPTKSVPAIMEVEALCVPDLESIILDYNEKCVKIIERVIFLHSVFTKMERHILVPLFDHTSEYKTPDHWFTFLEKVIASFSFVSRPEGDFELGTVRFTRDPLTDLMPLIRHWWADAHLGKEAMTKGSLCNFLGELKSSRAFGELSFQVRTDLALVEATRPSQFQKLETIIAVTIGFSPLSLKLPAGYSPLTEGVFKDSFLTKDRKKPLFSVKTTEIVNPVFFGDHHPVNVESGQLVRLSDQMIDQRIGAAGELEKSEFVQLNGRFPLMDCELIMCSGQTLTSPGLSLSVKKSTPLNVSYYDVSVGKVTIPICGSYKTNVLFSVVGPLWAPVHLSVYGMHNRNDDKNNAVCFVDYNVEGYGYFTLTSKEVTSKIRRMIIKQELISRLDRKVIGHLPVSASKLKP